MNEKRSVVKFLKYLIVSLIHLYYYGVMQGHNNVIYACCMCLNLLNYIILCTAICNITFIPVKV